MEMVFRRYSERATELAQNLTPRSIPSVEHPVVFFHLRKTGGTTLKKQMIRSAIEHNASYWSPCLGKWRSGSGHNESIPCRTYTLPTSQEERYAVYAGHLYFSDVKNVLDFYGPEQGVQRLREEPSFDCLTRLRPTVDRVISCWNYRFVEAVKGGNKLITADQLSAQQWDQQLPNTYSIYSEGCNNEIVRSFGSLADEHVVNTLTSGNITEKLSWGGNEQVLNRIFSRVSKCVILLTDRCKESNEVADFFYPWLNISGSNCGGNREKVSELPKALQPGADKIILKHNTLDEQIYQFATILFEEQLSIARANKNQTVV